MSIWQIGKRAFGQTAAGTKVFRRVPYSKPPFRQLQSRLPTFLATVVGTGLGYFSFKSDPKDKLPVHLAVPPLNLEQACEKLRQGEQSQSFASGAGRFDSIRLASNSPVEDDLVYEKAPGAGGNMWEFWGVFDGHAGWATSTILRNSLVAYVSRELNKTENVHEAIKTAFNNLDNDILTIAKNALNSGLPPASAEVVSAIAPAIAGSCALLAIFNPTDNTLRVACTGDSRAVMGRFSKETNNYVAEALSVDQTGFNKDEFARIEAEHPGEEGIIDPKTGRLLGIAITRAFGDVRWKWPSDLIKKSQEQFWGHAPRPTAKTQPYMTAEPIVKEVKIQGGQNGDFVILASDGLWDHISSEHAVECVAQWIRELKVASSPSPAPEFTLEDGKYAVWKAEPHQFVVEDDNAATHLVKNAFGGTRRNLFCGVMSTYPPISRNVRDDVTVQVIFFGDLDK